MGLRAGSVGGSRAFERSAYRRCCRRCRPMNSERGHRGPRQRKQPLRSSARERGAAGAAGRRTDRRGIEGKQVDDEAAHVAKLKLRGHGGVDRTAGRAEDGEGFERWRRRWRWPQRAAALQAQVNIEKDHSTYKQK